MASAPWGEVCPLVVEKRSATQKCGQTLEGRGLIATKSSVSGMTLEIQLCVEQLVPEAPPSPFSRTRLLLCSHVSQKHGE